MAIPADMHDQKPQLYFLLFILAVISILVFFIFQPFLYALILAMVFATVFQPVYQKMLLIVRGQKGIAAFATLLIVAIAVFTPLVFLGIQIFREAQAFYSSLGSVGGKDAILNIFNGLMSRIQEYFPSAQISFDSDQYVRRGLDWLIQHLGAVFGSFAKMLASAFVFLIALYYLLKDGHKVKSNLVSLSPLSDEHDEAIFKTLERAVNSVVRGNLFIAVIQGILVSVGFAIFGVPNAILWGSIAAIAALIPGIGTALVLIPAILFLFATGQIFPAIGLLAWGMGAVGLVDNFLGPRLMGRGIELHPLIILLSVLGGIGFFGPIGFLLGPLIVSLFFALLDIYSSLRKEISVT